MCVYVSVEWNTLQSPFYQGVAAGRLNVQGCGHGHRGCTRDYGSEEAPWRHSGTKPWRSIGMLESNNSNWFMSRMSIRFANKNEKNISIVCHWCPHFYEASIFLWYFCEISPKMTRSNDPSRYRFRKPRYWNFISSHVLSMDGWLLEMTKYSIIN